MTKQTILIVDDDINNISVLGKLLNQAGHKVAMAKGGEQAIERATKNVPSLILLDIIMHDMSGFDVIEKIKAIPKLSEVPVIFLSSLDDPETKVMGFELGAVDYISKPIKERECLARVALHLKLQSLSKEVNKQNSDLAAAKENAEEQVKLKTAELKMAYDRLLVSERTAVGTLRVFEEINQGIAYISDVGELKFSNSFYRKHNEFVPEHSWQPNQTVEFTFSEQYTFLLYNKTWSDGSYVQIITDITDIKSTHLRLLHASKIFSLGEMSTSVAHSLNQPLNVIRLAAANGRKILAGPNIDQNYLTKKLNRIESQTERASDIISHMRMFGNEDEQPPRSVELSALLNNTVEFLNAECCGAGIELAVEQGEEDMFVHCNEMKLQQAIINILRNAMYACKKSRADSRKISMHTKKGHSVVRVAIEDNGGGIQEGALGRIFEPFYTTKPMGQGIGLGLSISYGTINEMGGEIKAVNTGDGVCFTVTLPIIAAI
jgi:two-component system, LuxR family, sensor kinase FixL